MDSQNSIELAIRRYLERSATVRRGVYKISEEATELFMNAYEEIAKFMNSKVEEIFFVSSYIELPFPIYSEPFEEDPGKCLDFFNIMHRRSNYMYLSGDDIGFKGLNVVSIKSDILENMQPLELGGDMVLKVTKEDVIFDDIPFKFSAGTPDIVGVIALGAAAKNFIKVDVDSNVIRMKNILNRANLDYKYYEFSSCFRVGIEDFYAGNRADVKKLVNRYG